MTLSRCLAPVMVLVCGTLVWAAEPDPAAETFQSLFGADLARVKATREVKDDLELAARLVSAAKDAKSQPPLVALMCEKAYELSWLTPDGQATALEAMELEAEILPAKAVACADRIIEVRQKQFDLARGEERTKAGESLAAALLAGASVRAAATPPADATVLLRRALAVASAVKSEQRAEIEARLRVEDLRRLVERNPQDVAARDRLVRALVVDLDDPAQAVRYLPESGDESLRKFVPGAAKPLDEAPELACLELGEWYRGLGEAAPPAAKASMFARAQGYYRRFLELHTAEDLDRTKAAMALKKVQAELEKLGGAPTRLGGAAARLGGTAAKVRLPRKAGLLCTYLPRGTTLSAVAPVLSADARYLAAGCADGSLRLWEVETAKELLALPGEATPLAFSPDGRYLVAGGSPPGIRLYDVSSGKKKWDLPALPAPDSLVFRSDGKALMVHARTTVAQVDMETGKTLAQQSVAPEVSSVAFRPDGRVYYYFTKGGKVTACDPVSAKAVWEWRGQNGHRSELFLSSDSKLLVVVMNNTPRAYLLDAAAGQALGSADLSSAGSNVLPQCGATADGQRLWALGGSVAGAALFDLRTGKALGRIPGISVDASMSPDGRRIAMGQEKGTRVLVVDVVSGRQVAECAKLDGVTKPFAWTPDGQHLFAYRPGGGVYLFGIGPWN